MTVRLPSTYDDQLLAWVERLTGVGSDRVRDAVSRAARWKIGHVNRVLIHRPSIDGAVAVTLLTEALVSLTTKNVPESKLLSKLRRDPDVWPTWAELRAAALLSRLLVPKGHFAFEPGGTASAQPDFLLTAETRTSSAIEFKAIGLSDEEVAFCQRMSPALEALLPRHGLITLHAALDTERVRTETLSRSQLDADAAGAADSFPDFPAGLAGVIIPGHLGEGTYRRRLWRRVRDEISAQLVSTSGGWAALYWTNGTDIDSLVDSIVWGELPPHIDGIIVVGDAVAFPQPTIHSFCFMIPRGSDPTGDGLVWSSVDADFAISVMRRFDRSSGVRPMLLVDQSDQPGSGGLELLRRDHERRILPFNFIIDADPHAVIGKRISGRQRK
jgi:hypothetical protein